MSTRRSLVDNTAASAASMRQISPIMDIFGGAAAGAVFCACTRGVPCSWRHPTHIVRAPGKIRGAAAGRPWIMIFLCGARPYLARHHAAAPLPQLASSDALDGTQQQRRIARSSRPSGAAASPRVPPPPRATVQSSHRAAARRSCCTEHKARPGADTIASPTQNERSRADRDRTRCPEDERGPEMNRVTGSPSPAISLLSLGLRVTHAGAAPAQVAGDSCRLGPKKTPAVSYLAPD